MTYFDTLAHNPQFGQFGPQQQGGWGALGSQGGLGQGGVGLGQAAYGQQYGQYGGQQPFGAFGYNPAWGGQPMGWGQQWGGQQRQLSQQDVNEVVRQILPIVPQIVGMLQSQQQPHYAAMQGGLGQGQFGGLGQQLGGLGQPGLGHPAQAWGTQFGAPQFQSAFGGPMAFGQQRQLTQQDVADITRQLIGVIPQVIGNLQAYSQQRMI